MKIPLVMSLCAEDVIYNNEVISGNGIRDIIVNIKCGTFLRENGMLLCERN